MGSGKCIHITATLLKRWTNEHKNPDYNPASLLEDLWKIIRPKMNNFLEEIPSFLDWSVTESVTKSHIFVRTLSILDRNREFISILIDEYLSEDFGQKIGLDDEDTNELQINACYLVSAYTTYLLTCNAEESRVKSLDPKLLIWLEKYHGDIYYYLIHIISAVLYNSDDGTVEKFVCEIDRMIFSILDRLHNLIETVTIDTSTNEFHDGDEMSLGIQIIFIMKSLCMLNKQPKILDLLITKYNIESTFMKFLNKLKNCEFGYSCEKKYFQSLLLYFMNRRFCIQFINAGGLQIFLNIPHERMNLYKTSGHLYYLSSSAEVMSLICQQDAGMLNNLMSHAINLINNENLLTITGFFKNAFAYGPLLWKFDEINGLERLNNLFDPCRLNMLHIKSWIIIFKQYVTAHLFWSDRMQRIGHQSFSIYDPCNLISNDIEDKIKRVQRLGKYCVFFSANSEQSPADVWVHCRELLYKLIKLLLRGNQFLSRASKPGTIPHYIVRNALYIIKMLTVNLTAVDDICCYNEGPWISEGIMCLVKCIEQFSNQVEALRVLNSCLWTAIYGVHVDNVYENIFNGCKNHELFNKLLQMLKYSLSVNDILRDLKKNINKNVSNLRLQILVALSFDNDIKNIVVYYCAKYLNAEFWIPLVPPEEDTRWSLYRKYALKIVKLITEERAKNAGDKNERTIPKNITLRLLKRPLECDRPEFYEDFIYNKFKKAQAISWTFDNLYDENDVLPWAIDFCTACQYSPCGRKLYVGTKEGKLITFDINTGREMDSFHYTELSFINQIRTTKSGNFLLLNSEYTSGPSVLSELNGRISEITFWKYRHQYAEFSKLEDKIIASTSKSVTLYDIQTNSELMTLDASICHSFSNGSGTFSMHDDLILNNTILFDAKSGKEIYKFGRFNNSTRGFFHPNGNEVIFNHCIWDLRNCSRIINFAPALTDMPSIVFSTNKCIIYAFNPMNDNNEGSFGVVNSSNYTSLVEPCKGDKPHEYINDLACNPFGTSIAVVENVSTENIWDHPVDVDTKIQFYDIGMID